MSTISCSIGISATVDIENIQLIRELINANISAYVFDRSNRCINSVEDEPNFIDMLYDENREIEFIRQPIIKYVRFHVDVVEVFVEESDIICHPFSFGDTDQEVEPVCKKLINAWNKFHELGISDDRIKIGYKYNLA